MVPGLKLSITTSASATSRSKTSCPSGLLRFRVTALVAAEHLPPQPDPVLRVPVGPRGVAPRVLDLQYLGPEVPEHRRGERPGEERRRVYDLYTFERFPLRQRPAPPSDLNPALHLAHAPSRRKVLTGSRTPAMFLSQLPGKG